MSQEKQARKLLPFLQTTALANELIGLQMSIQGGFIKLKEKSTARKDRYSALAYINQLATNLEKDLVEDVVEEDYDKFLKTYEIKELVKKYSDYVRYPIKMYITKKEPKKDEEGKTIEGEYNDITELETLN